MLNHLLNQAFLLKFNKGLACQRATDLETLRHNSRGDKLVGGNFLQYSFHNIIKPFKFSNPKYYLVELFICGLVKKNKIVQLVTSFSFRPLLLLGFSTSSFLLFGWCRLRRCLRGLRILFRSLLTTYII